MEECIIKKCSKCGVEKSLDEYYKQKDGKFGTRADCKCCAKEYYVEYDAKPEVKAKKAENYQVNREEIIAKQAEYDAKPENKARQVENYQANREEILTRQAEYQKQRKATDPLYKLRCNIRTLICKSFLRSDFKKSSKTAQILGCTFEEFKVYIESQFQEGMSWDSRSLWHLDHIYPVSLAENEEHLIQLNHYTNFQPLWAEDNRRKGNKIIDNVE